MSLYTPPGRGASWTAFGRPALKRTDFGGTAAILPTGRSFGALGPAGSRPRGLFGKGGKRDEPGLLFGAWGLAWKDDWAGFEVCRVELDGGLFAGPLEID